jgi:hypothetical protein
MKNLSKIANEIAPKLSKARSIYEEKYGREFSEDDAFDYIDIATNGDCDNVQIGIIFDIAWKKSSLAPAQTKRG